MGMEDCAPGFVHASAPASMPVLIASGKDLPAASSTVSAPVKASPAAVVSTGVIGKDGKCWEWDLLIQRAPLSESLMMSSFDPLSRRI